MAVSVDRIRIGGSKVRTGCRTCKTRRIKCDEARPACKRCVKSGRACEGYLSSPNSTQIAIGHRFVHYIDPNQSIIPSPESTPSPHADLDLHALRSLDFFLRSTAMQLEQPFNIGTWSRGLSCFMHSQPAVKYGLIAVAALHENFQHPSKSIFAEQRKVLALEHYGKSIGGIVQINVQNAGQAVGPTLVASLLFCAIESLQGHFSSAMKHIVAGIELLSDCEDNIHQLESLPSSLFDALRRAFISLGMQAMALEETRVWPVISRLLKQSHYLTSCCFSNTEQALAEIAHLQADGMRVLTWSESCNKEPSFPSLELQQAFQALHQRFCSWNVIYSDLLTANDSIDEINDYQMRLAFLTLRVNRHVTTIMLNVVFVTDQTCFDALAVEFEGVVSTAEEIARVELERTKVSKEPNRPVFGMTLGIVPALFFTCVRCRHHSIRHRALSLLKKMRRREAIWDAMVVSAVAEKVIAIEEEAAAHYRNVTGAGIDSLDSLDQMFSETTDALHSSIDLPEPMRIRTLEIDFLGSENTAKVYLKNVAGSNAHQKIIAWDE